MFSSRPVSEKTVEPTSETTSPLVPPVRVTWYAVTPVSSSAGSQVRTTETPSARAVTPVGAVGAWVSGACPAQGSSASRVTLLSATVETPAGMV